MSSGAAPESPKPPNGLRYISLGDHTGYATHGKTTLAALLAAGVPVTWTPMIPGRRLGYAYQPVDAAGWGPAPFDRICNIRIPYQNAIVNTVAEYYPFWRARLPQQKYRLYGQTTWETDRLPPHWPDLVNLMDGVLVSSDWNRRTFLESGVTIPIRVIPPLSQFNGCPPAGKEGEKALANMQQRLALAGVQGRFLFYTIGQWTERKGLDLLVQAFCRAFTAGENVALIIKTEVGDFRRSYRAWSNGFHKAYRPVEETLSRLVSEFANPPRIVLLTDLLSDLEIQALHTLGDCYVSTSRGEGWGYGAYEAAWFGKRVIAADHPGHREFLPEEYTWPIKTSPGPVGKLSGWEANNYQPGQTWQTVDLDDAAQKMRAVMENDRAAERARQLKEFVSQKILPPRAIIAQLLSFIEGL